MTPVFLSERDRDSIEQMDYPDCDRDKLMNTYRQFNIINRLLSRWRKTYEKYIKPELKKNRRPCTLLDIGSGGGDIPAKLADWSAEDGLDLQITAIDTDHRACEFMQSQPSPENITFLNISSSELINHNEHFDIVISNHLIHHLSTEDLQSLLTEAEQLSTKLVLFNDIERSDLGYTLFNVFSRPLFSRSFITEDGLTSIKRSYTYSELKKIILPGWNIQRLFPYRLLLSYHHV